MSRYHRAVACVGSDEEKIEMLQGEWDYADRRVREARSLHNEAQAVYWELKRRQTAMALDELATPCLF